MLPAPPPDFRLVGVEPGPSLKSARKVKLVAAAVAFFVGLLAAFHLDWVTVGLALALSLGAVVIVQRSLGPVLGRERLSEARMSIVPWGVLVHDEPEPRVLHWGAVRQVSVACVHEMDHATPSTRWSVVKIRTERETLGGRAPGDVALERLEAHVDRYAAEAARPLSLDLDGSTDVELVFEPVVERLLGEARRLLRSGVLDERLALSPRSYRHPGSVPLPETRGVLTEVLRGGLAHRADPRALAALLAAELGESELLEELLSLTTSPHPLVAAIARASAFWLGGDVKRVGALDELSDFVPAADIGLLRAWLQEKAA
ncbi:MAG: hypothetical protein IPI67_05535 [Myxococcales bacterium]|nr:hypothetical protein [Myxococcales bacterium]